MTFWRMCKISYPQHLTISHIKSEYGQTMQKLRGTIIEGVFEQAKTYHGMARSKFRGISKVEIQFLLTATALNLEKMIKILSINCFC